jgi:hypothetical protein
MIDARPSTLHGVAVPIEPAQVAPSLEVELAWIAIGIAVVAKTPHELVSERDHVRCRRLIRLYGEDYNVPGSRIARTPGRDCWRGSAMTVTPFGCNRNDRTRQKGTPPTKSGHCARRTRTLGGRRHRLAGPLDCTTLSASMASHRWGWRLLRDRADIEPAHVGGRLRGCTHTQPTHVEHMG